MFSIESDDILQKQEIEFLESSYPEIIKLDNNFKSFIIAICQKDDQDREIIVQIEITLPKDYPSNSSASFKLSSLQLDSEKLHLLSDKLNSLSKENKGESICFIWLNTISEFLVDYLTNLGIVSDNKDTREKNEKLLTDELGLETEDYNDDDYDDEYDYSYRNEYKNVDDHLFEKINTDNLTLPTIYHGELVHDRKSVFQGHLAPVTDQRQVPMVVSKLKENKKINEATHNIISYRIDGHNGYFISGCFDDGEIHAGSRMLHLMNLVDARDVLVVVTRWYGGIHLGADRYKHINNITRDLLDQYGYIKVKPNSKKIQSNKKNNSAKIKN